MNKSTITYKGQKYYITGETSIFYICEAENRNIGTSYIPKSELTAEVKTV